MEKEDQPTKPAATQNKKKTTITIPSYQEVIESSEIKSTPTQNLFAPSQSFSQAFSFIKSSEFYEPPVKSTTTQNPTSSQSGASNVVVASTSSQSQYNQSRNAILVSHRQKGNPLLKHIRNVRWAFADVVCDYMLGQNSCALYLSLRYHLLHPDYLYYRIRELQKNFKLRVVLCHIDVDDVVKPLLEVTKTAMLHDCTLLCAWSLEECGRYLETIKVYENKPADLIQGQMDSDYLSWLTHSLTTVRRVNKTDVVTLGSTFGSLSHIMDASMEDLARCPGIGERKVKRLHDTFHEPFKRVVTSHPPFPETPVQNDAEPCLETEEVTGVEKDTEDTSIKRRKKETELTVKSALSAAFAKYADKIGNKSNNSPGKKRGETSATKSGDENGSIGEEATG